MKLTATIVLCACLNWLAVSSSYAGSESLILHEDECKLTGASAESKQLDKLKELRIIYSCDLKAKILRCWSVGIERNGTLKRIAESNINYDLLEKNGDKFYLENKKKDFRLLLDLGTRVYKSSASAYGLADFSLIDRTCNGSLFSEETFIKGVKKGK